MQRAECITQRNDSVSVKIISMDIAHITFLIVAVRLWLSSLLSHRRLINRLSMIKTAINMAMILHAVYTVPLLPVDKIRTQQWNKWIKHETLAQYTRNSLLSAMLTGLSTSMASVTLQSRSSAGHLAVVAFVWSRKSHKFLIFGPPYPQHRTNYTN